VEETVNWYRKCTDIYSVRTLDDGIPELKQYLQPGMKVLDVGCGPGPITLDVAQMVKHGTAFGIEPMAGRIAAAVELAEQRNITNVIFDVASAFDLPFPDDSFDVVYSHTVLHHLIDPVQALREQKRVTKREGYVIAAGVRDLALVQRYPRCPMLEKVFQAWARYNESIGKQRHWKDHDALKPAERFAAELYYWDWEAGRKCPEWFTKAGLTNLQVKVKLGDVEYHGSKITGLSKLNLFSADGAESEIYRDMFSKGFLNPDTLSRAKAELDCWYSNPNAFCFSALIMAIGTA